jgi:excisionase family DNA binding protein
VQELKTTMIEESAVPKPLLEAPIDCDAVAQLLQIHPKTVQRLARQKKLPGYRVGDLWRFYASEVDAAVRSGLCSNRHSCRN